MSLMMNRALVIIVLVGFVFCEKKNGTSTSRKPHIQAIAPPDGNSSSSVVIENKVQNLKVDYQKDHSPTKNTSYVIKPPTASSNTTGGKPLIISTSKEVRLIQSHSIKLNDSLAIATTKSNGTQRHPNLLTRKNNINNHKKDAPRYFLPTINSTAPTTTVRPKSPEKVFENRNNITKLGPTTPSGQSYSYSYFKLSKPKNTSSNIDVERMEVKEMRYLEDRNENKKFQFFIVSDGDSPDSDEQPHKNSSSNNDKFQEKNHGNQHQQKSLSHKEKNGHSKPYQEDWVPKKYSGHGHLQSAPPKSTTPMSVYTVRPSRHHGFNISSTTSNPSVTYKKANVSSPNLVKNEITEAPTRNFSCLRCVENSKGVKHHKYPTYPSKKDPSPVDGARAVKLQGPDGDSILGDSKHHYAISKPVGSHTHSNSSRIRVPKSGMNNYYKQQQGYLGQKERRKPFMGLDNAGSYSSHVGGSPEYSKQNPEVEFSPDARFRTKGTIKPDMSDLYNLDELESSGSSMFRSHVKYDHREIHIPYPVTVEKKVSYPIHIKVDRLVPVHIDKPYPVHVEKKVPVPVKVHVPQPYPVEKEVPYPVKIPIEVPRPVEVAKPVPYIVEKHVPIQVIKEVKFPVKVPVDVPIPYKVPVHVEKRVPYFVEKKVPFEVPVPVEKPYFIEVKKPFEVPVEKPHPVTVEKKIPVPMQVIEFVKVPVPVKAPIEGYNGYQHRSSESRSNQEQKDGNSGAVSAQNKEDPPSEGRQSDESKLQRRMGTEGSVSNEREQVVRFPHNLPNMISIEFSHPDLNRDPIVTSFSDYSKQPDVDRETPTTLTGTSI